MQPSAEAGSGQPGAAPLAGARGAPRLALALVAALVGGYTLVRARTLSLTHDEALTYWIAVREPWRAILTQTTPLAANSHLLNTVLIKLGVAALGNAELVLRLPALLGLALYALGVLRILRGFLRGWGLVLGFALLLTNPLLLDFFGLARGYGLGLGFFALGLDGLLRRATAGAERERTRAGLWSIVCLTLAVLANLSFAGPFLAGWLVLLILELVVLRRGARPHASVLAALLLAAAGLRIVYSPEVVERLSVDVGWGGSTGFLWDTVASLVTDVGYGRPYAAGAWAYAGTTAVTLVVLVAGAAALRSLLARRLGPEERALVLLVGLGVLLVLGVELQVFLFHLPYPTERKALYFVPLFLVIVLLLWRRAPGRAGRAGALLLLLALFVHQVSCANLTHTLAWKYDASTKEATELIGRLAGGAPGGTKRTIGVDWVFSPAMNYYIERERLGWLEPTDRHGPEGDFDFYYVRDRGWLERRGLSPLRSFELSGSHLAARAGAPAGGVPASDR